MYKEVLIARADGAEVATGLMANAATPYRYKQIFGEDLLEKFTTAQSQIDGNGIRGVDFLPELAYVMALQAERDPAKLDKAKKSDFYAWIEQFESFAFENAAEDIINVYIGNLAGSSTAKKNNGRQTGK